MLKEKILSALNNQMNRELYSAYLYLSMAAYFESTGLKGFANWMRVQFQEELIHAMKFFDYIINRAVKAELLPIEKPPAEWKSANDVFQNAYKHEQKVTALINDLVNLSLSESDHSAVNFLQWFVNEQVEEESSFSDILNKLNLISDSKEGSFMLDREMSQRVFTGTIFTTQTKPQAPQNAQ
ncbi:MAG: ferritin [Endomicrobiia bacterium]|nr:ferritin [Endomicrobiia bacterium]